MPLYMLYTDDKTNEERELYIKTLSNVSYPTESTITEHPTETKKNIIDNSIDTLREISTTIIIPGKEEIVDSNKVIADYYSNKFLDNTTKISKQNSNESKIPLINVNQSNPYISSTIADLNFQDAISSTKQYRFKEEVYKLIQTLRISATPILLYTGNSYFDGGQYLIKSIKHSESIDEGDWLKLEIVFKECRIVNSQTIQLSTQQITLIKSLLASGSSNAKKVIKNKNKSTKQSDKGKVSSTRDKSVDKVLYNYGLHKDEVESALQYKNGEIYIKADDLYYNTYRNGIISKLGNGVGKKIKRAN